MQTKKIETPDTGTSKNITPPFSYEQRVKVKEKTLHQKLNRIDMLSITIGESGVKVEVDKAFAENIKQQIANGIIAEDWPSLDKSEIKPRSIPIWCNIPGAYFQRENPLKAYERSIQFLHLFDHDPSKVLNRFKLGQTVYFFGQEGRVWDGLIKKIDKGEALVQGKGLSWISLDLLYLTLDEAYSVHDKEKEAKNLSDWKKSRAEMFSIGQEAYFIALDCGKHKVLKCSIIDMGEHEAHIKLDSFTRRSVVDPLDVFPDEIEATIEAEERSVSLKYRG